MIGLGGINLKANPEHRVRAFTHKGNLEAAARTLRFYLDKHNGDYKQALWSYKGRGKNGLGLRQAKAVLHKVKELR